MKKLDPIKTHTESELTITETAEFLDCSRTSVYAMIEDGRLETKRIRNTTYVLFKKEIKKK